MIPGPCAHWHRLRPCPADSPPQFHSFSLFAGQGRPPCGASVPGARRQASSRLVLPGSLRPGGRQHCAPELPPAGRQARQGAPVPAQCAHAMLHCVHHPGGLHVAGRAREHARLTEPVQGARGVNVIRQYGTTAGAAAGAPLPHAAPPLPRHRPSTSPTRQPPARHGTCSRGCSPAGSPPSAGYAPCPHKARAQSAGRGLGRTRGA